MVSGRAFVPETENRERKKRKRKKKKKECDRERIWHFLDTGLILWFNVNTTFIIYSPSKHIKTI
jgi:hypothetical protein